MVLLAARKRFAGLGPETVRQIVDEIAAVGHGGLDYASAEEKYTLRTLPGERFSGLQLMCLMVAGFKEIEPGLETGMPFAEADRRAVELFAGEE